MTLWFTADTHFGHSHVIRFSDRPFASVGEMDAELIRRWNAVVGPRDEVWHLGDFCWTKEPESYVQQLNGRIHLVLGNHDRRRMSLLDAGMLFASVQDVKYLRRDGLRFWLSHYAHRTWPKANHGTYHLYGHSHGDLPGVNRSMDVGVDANDYAPISMDAVVAELQDAAFTQHHTERDRHEEKSI